MPNRELMPAKKITAALLANLVCLKGLIEVVQRTAELIRENREEEVDSEVIRAIVYSLGVDQEKVSLSLPDAANRIYEALAKALGVPTAAKAEVNRGVTADNPTSVRENLRLIQSQLSILFQMIEGIIHGTNHQASAEEPAAQRGWDWPLEGTVGLKTTVSLADLPAADPTSGG